MSDYLLDKIMEYDASDAYPLHMPGHKRRISLFDHPYSLDITEIEGFDNLHHPEGILLEAQERAAKLYGADETFYLINGSTCGILAAISASVRRGGRILMARNSHKAAYHAAMLNGLRVTWLYPEMDMRRGIYGSIQPEQVRAGVSIAHMPAAADPIQAVFITSPTYDGVVSDIRAIADEAHRTGAILIVDEAHGAHFAMHPYFPESALACGADIVINSLHKTMPSLTQTALLHVKGARADVGRLKKYLEIYQSSSPSYVLMAGMDECVRMMEGQRRELFDRFVVRLEGMREHLGSMKVLHLVTGMEPELSAFAFDRSKILISADGGGNRETAAQLVITASGLARVLRERYHLEVEMEAEHYITAIMTVADTQEGFERLERALLEIDAQLAAAVETPPRVRSPLPLRSVLDACHWQAEPAAGFTLRSGRCLTSATGAQHRGGVYLPHPLEEMTMEQADSCPHESVPLKKSPGRTAAEFVYLYPPGIPLLVPGERIPEELPELLEKYRGIGLKLQGMADYRAETIQCIT